MDQLFEAIRALFSGQAFGWKNVLDSAIVFVFVYYLLRLIRGTRAVQLLLGVLVLVVIYGLAVLFQLTLTKLLFQAFLAIAVFAILIVFQPELRRGLGQLGQLGPLNRLLTPSDAEAVDRVVDELTRAALLISGARNGALIVVERGTGLQDYTETGVPVNGRLSAELLASIFMVRSPLHDGAVIIRGPQIVAAACLLPLEDTQDRASHRYGMRHRAALSISSQTDAIVVVVSEETQAISIASSGRIIGGPAAEPPRPGLRSPLPSRLHPPPFLRQA